MGKENIRAQLTPRRLLLLDYGCLWKYLSSRSIATCTMEIGVGESFELFVKQFDMGLMVHWSCAISFRFRRF